jgi:hypothetical protein
MFSDNMFKIPLINNSKRPIKGSWVNNKTKKPINGNYGILTGSENNITVIDIDFYDKNGKKFDFDNSPFLKKFGLNYLKKFNTLTQKTTSGGYHLIFKYDKDLKQTASPQMTQIDIRNDGGYIVGFGSVVNGKEYKIQLDTEIQEIPKDLKNWLIENLYTKNEIKIMKRKELKAIPESGEFVYNGNEKILREIFERIDKRYFTDYGTGKVGERSWLNFTTFCKMFNCQKLWDEYSKKYCPNKYDREQNLRMWNSCDIKYDCFKKIFNDKSLNSIKHYKYYMKYKPTPKYNLKPDITIDREKLGYKFFTEFKNDVLIKSDTGTGKTTSFKNYVKDNDIKFISIVSRISLADEQYKTFNNFGIDCIHYQDLNNETTYFNEGDNLIITVDSLLKLLHYTDDNDDEGYNQIDLKGYTIFLDEFNSILEHLINSPTLKNYRTFIFDYFIKLINNSKRYIGVDADISDISNKFMDVIERPHKLIVNNYKHNKGVKAHEITSFKDLINDIKNKTKYMVCCDSKKNAEYLFEKLEDKTIKLITSDTEEFESLDKYNKIIFSPKIIYGLDSTIKRDVYCYYNTSTINPLSMLQQVARTRNIIELKYYFENKRLNPPMYKDLEDCEFVNRNILKLEKQNKKVYDPCDPSTFLNSYQRLNKKVKDIYFKLYCMVDYKNDCFKTNISLHFILLLKERGFEINNDFLKIKGVDIKDKIEVVNSHLIENFDIEGVKVKNLAKLLNLQTKEKIEEYKKVFLYQKNIEEHFAICSYLYKNNNDLINKMSLSDDMLIKKIKSRDNKILFLKELQEKVEFNDKKYFEVNKTLSKKESDKYIKKYKLLFRDRRNVEIDFTKKYDLIKIIVKMIKNIIGDKINSDKKQIEGKRINIYCWTSDYLNIELPFHNKLNLERNPAPVKYEF